MECGKPCKENFCDSCIEEAAIASAMNMGPAEQITFVDMTDEEIAEVFKWLDENKELMEDLRKQGD